MISYVTIGASDIARAKAFYDVALGSLGHVRIFDNGEILGYGLADGSLKPKVWIYTPENGKPMSVGNGSMVGLHADTPADVDRFYRAGLSAGGTCEGTPGIRPHYPLNYYLAYVRDPDGNKLSAFCNRFDMPAGTEWPDGPYVPPLDEKKP